MNCKKLKVEFAEEGIIVKSSFWEVVHDPRKGGCITSIRFLHGSGENVLKSPIASYFGSYLDVLNDNTAIRVIDRDGFVEVEACGRLIDENSYTVSDIDYAYTYKYSEGYVKIVQKYTFEKPVADVKRVGIGCMNLTPRFKYFAARPSHVRVDKPYGNCAAVWGGSSF